MASLENKVLQEEQRQRQEMAIKRQQIENAERLRHGPVDDSQLVDQMFDFIHEQPESGAAPSAFKVTSQKTQSVYVTRIL